MNRFILAVNCPVCGNTIEDDGYTIDCTADDDVVVLDNFACVSFHCSNCNTDVYVGDTDSLYEYEDSEDDE